MTALAFLALFAVLLGAACGISALVQLQKVKAELAELKKQLKDPAPAPMRSAPVMAQQPIAEMNPLSPLSITTPLPSVSFTKTSTELAPANVLSAIPGWI